MAQALIGVFFVLAPAGILLLVGRFSNLRKIGPIVLCYILGITIGIAGLFPASSDAIRTTVTEASLALALPLLLFSVDMRAWRNVAGRAMLSMLLAVIAVVFISTLLFYSFSSYGVDDSAHLTAMAVGMYTGGVANLGAIKHALEIPDTRYLLFATVDTVVGAFFLMFVLTSGQKFFGRFLQPFPDQHRIKKTAEKETHSAKTVFSRNSLRAMAIALLASAACVGISVTMAPLIGFASPEIMVIVLLTSLGLLASFIPTIRANPTSQTMGMYLIYVFSLCIAASLDLDALAGMDMTILVFVLVATFGSLFVHALLCRIMGIDVDTFLITAVAALMSPAFVPMVARNLKNPAILMSGMATGILGFAIGNYLGISVAVLLMSGD